MGRFVRPVALTAPYAARRVARVGRRAYASATQRRSTGKTSERSPMRQFIRHPIHVPIEISAEASDARAVAQTNDVSLGGLAVRSNVAVVPGARVEIRIGYVQPAFEAHARVAWCQPHADEGYELGVTFLDAEVAFLARMVEQICHIEDYRQSVHRLEGRQLSSEEAAGEWIERYAEHFPEIGAGVAH
jgi:hypothetical protein